MASPFPGMDPYLEGSGWMTMYTGLSVEIARQLTPLLSDRYTALLNEWFVVAMPQAADGVMVSSASGYPDAYVADTGVQPGAGRASSAVVAGQQARGGPAGIFAQATPDASQFGAFDGDRSITPWAAGPHGGRLAGCSLFCVSQQGRPAAADRHLAGPARSAVADGAGAPAR
jgi:hypothetical protein